MQVEISSGRQEFPERKFRKYRLKRISGHTYIGHVPEQKIPRLQRKAEKRGLYFRAYEEKYGRGTSYRARFIRENPPVRGRYRCVYCGRRIRKSEMTVDHVIPVLAAKTSEKAQKRLAKIGGVNDPRNLVPACRRCNAKKGDTYSAKWIRRARRGRHGAWWIARDILVAALLAVFAAAAYRILKGNMPGDLENLAAAAGRFFLH